ncbi:MAG: polysaccharide deacetylase family protein [Sulfolobaceae archaeon]
MEVSVFNRRFEQPMVLISFDVESPVDSYDNDFTKAKIAGVKNRIGLKKLIDLSERYETPFTLFCTGHALLKECKGHNLHVNIYKKNPKYGFHVGNYSWHYLDPASDYTQYPEFYYGDLIERFKKSNIGHEIASHSFSHIPYALVDDNTVYKDLSRSFEVFETFLSEKPFSFSFPYNLAGKYHILSKFGIKICRIGHEVTNPITLRGGILAVRTHITDFALNDSLNSWIKIIDKIKKRKYLLNWYLHPASLYDEQKFNVFWQIISYLKRQEINMLTFRELYNILKQEL